MQLNITFLPTYAEILILIVLLCAIIAGLLLYRRFPMHLIYRSKIGCESMLDALSEPLAVISKDFTVRRVNKAYIDMAGCSYKAAINAKCYKLLRNRTTPCVDCRLSDTLFGSSMWEVETSPHPSGTGSVSITFAPYAMPTGGSGAELCVLENIRDITALEELKNELERRNNFLLTLTRKLRKAQRSIKSDLRVARQIQLGLLPENITRINRLRVDMTYKSVTDVGGDLYDFIPIDDNRVGVFIGDASGHGLASSLIGTLSKMSLYNHSHAALPTSELLSRMNRDLKAHIHTSHYLTCFWCVFDFERNRLTYSRAGHPIQIVLRKDGSLHGLSGNGIFLGITEEAEFEEKVFNFQEGDRFYWFTDGIYDVFRKNAGAGMDDFLGYNKFTEIVRSTAGIPIENVVGKIKCSLVDYRFEDDYTLIVAEVC